jgi:helix-turn-helix protein
LLDLWRANRGLYGAEKLWTAALDGGISIGRDQVARLMAILGIEGVRRGKHPTKTTTRDPEAAPAWVVKGLSGEAPGLGRGYAEEAEAGLGELVDGVSGDPLGVALVEAQQTEETAGDGAERDFDVGDGGAAGGLAGADVAEGAGCSAGCVDEGRGRRR